MASQRISVRVPRSIEERLKQRSKLNGTPESQVVREALEAYFAKTGEGQSAYDHALVAGLIGCARRARKDLSTNKQYFKDFGKAK
jgi:hypothetical protein